MMQILFLVPAHTWGTGLTLSRFSERSLSLELWAIPGMRSPHVRLGDHGTALGDHEIVAQAPGGSRQ